MSSLCCPLFSFKVVVNRYAPIGDSVGERTPIRFERIELWFVGKTTESCVTDHASSWGSFVSLVLYVDGMVFVFGFWLADSGQSGNCWLMGCLDLEIFLKEKRQLGFFLLSIGKWTRLYLLPASWSFFIQFVAFQCLDKA